MDVAPLSTDPALQARLLVLDDDPVWAELTTERLRTAGFAPDHVHTAQSTTDADLCLGQYDVDVIFVDFRLGGQSGLDYAARLLERDPDAVIVMLSAHVDPDLEHEAAAIGCTDLLAKDQAQGDAMRRSVRHGLRHREDRRALRASAERYHAVAQNIPDAGVLTCDAELRVTSVDGPLYRRVGIEAERLVGADLRTALRALRMEPHIARYEAAANGLPCQYEQTGPTGDTFLVNFGPLAGPDGRAAGAMSVAIDITAHRRAEADRERAHREAEAARLRQRLVLDNLPGTIVALYDRSLHVVDVDGLSDDPGQRHSRESAQGQPLRSFFSPEEYAALEPSMLRALGGQPASIEHHNDDGRHWRVEIAPFVESGEVTGVLTVWHDVTASRATEQLLRERGHQLAEAQRVAHIGSWQWEVGGMHVDWSEELCRIFGQPNGFAPTPMQFMGLVHPEDHDAVSAGLNESLAADGDGNESTYRIVRPDGEVRWIHSRRHVRATGDGSPAISYGTIQDVTDLMAEQRARREADHQLHVAFHHAPIGMAMVAMDGAFLRANQAICAITGYDRDAIRRLPPFAFVHPEDRDQVAAIFGGIGQGRDEVSLHHRIVRSDGALAWVHAQITLMRDVDETPLYLLAQVTDVTEQHIGQERLGEVLARLHGAFEQAPTGMALVGMDGRLVQVNDALCSLLGHERAYLESVDLATITHPDDRAGSLAGPPAPGTNEPTVMRAERRFLHAGGGVIWAAMSTSVMRDAAGAPAHMVCHFVNMTDRRTLEEELRHLAEHDSLTGLLNRRRFARDLAAHMALRRRYGAGGAVLLLDIDRFKSINDDFGHGAGDDAIVAVAAMLRAELRDTDLVARLGGDEFAALLPYADAAAAAEVAERLVEASRRLEAGGRGLTISIGAAELGDCRGLTVDEAIARADHAMYEAKRLGRNQAFVAEAPPAPHA